MDVRLYHAVQLALVVTSEERPSKHRIRVGQRLREVRIDRGDTAAEVGRRLGVSQQRLSQWENGEGRPPVERAEAIADYLGIDLAEVLLLIHADATNRTSVDATLTNTLNTIEQTLQELMLKQQHLAERLELLADPEEQIDDA